MARSPQQRSAGSGCRQANVHLYAGTSCTAASSDPQLSKFVVFALLGIAYETYLNIADQIGRESASGILASLGDVPAKITGAYISQSSYWLSFFP